MIFEIMPMSSKSSVFLGVRLAYVHTSMRDVPPCLDPKIVLYLVISVITRFSTFRFIFCIIACHCPRFSNYVNELQIASLLGVLLTYWCTVNVRWPPRLEPKLSFYLVISVINEFSTFWFYFCKSWVIVYGFQNCVTEL